MVTPTPTVPQITTSKPKKNPVPSVFTVGDLDVADLQIATYQRDLYAQWVLDHIVSKFDPIAFGYLLVANRQTGYWVVDGQQRREAATQLGYTHVPCMVFNSSGEDYEAKVFRLVNDNKKKMAPWDLWKSRLVACDPVAAAINSTLSLHKIKMVQKVAGPYQTQTVQAILKTYSNLSLPQFSDLFDVLVQAFGGCRDSLTDLFINGLGLLYEHYGNKISKYHLVALLKKKNLAKWRTLAEEKAIRLGGSGYIRYKGLELVVLDSYDRMKGIPQKLRD